MIHLTSRCGNTPKPLKWGTFLRQFFCADGVFRGGRVGVWGGFCGGFGVFLRGKMGKKKPLAGLCADRPNHLRPTAQPQIRPATALKLPALIGHLEAFSHGLLHGLLHGL